MIKFKRNNNNFLKIISIGLLLALLIGLLFTNAIKMIIIYPFIGIMLLLMVTAWVFRIVFFILIFIVSIILDKDVDDFINNNKTKVILYLLFTAMLVWLIFLNYQYTEFIKSRWVSQCKDIILSEKDRLSLETIQFLDKNKDKYCISKDIIPDFLVTTVLFDKNEIDKEIERNKINKETQENVANYKEAQKEEIIKKYTK